MAEDGAGLNRRQWLGAVAAVTGLAISRRGLATTMATSPKLNQIGFLPGASKHFCCAGADDNAPIDFVIERNDGRAVYRGSLAPKVHDVTATTGEYVRRGDFSQVKVPGVYRVRVGTALSHPFAIGEGVYAPLIRDAARCFYIIRANVALDDPVTGLRHKVGHQQDAALLVDGVPRDLTGGWYNAGDYGKWTHMAAISASQIMWLHELRPACALALKLGVPQTYPGLPDLLQQARWGLDWLLRMQDSAGAVTHKVDTEPNFAWGLLPDADPNVRKAGRAGSVDAGVFVGVMLQAARVFATLESGFAARCHAAALKSWGWLEANPDVDHHDIYYPDPQPGHSAAWALVAMAAATQDPALDRRAIEAVEKFGSLPFSWQTPQVLGIMSLAMHGAPVARAAAVSAIMAAAAGVKATVDADPYGYSAQPAHFFWGSLESALDGAVTCLFAQELDKTGSSGGGAARDTAQRLLDYALGSNSLGLSFVTGHGTKRVEHPYHWTYRTQQRIMPGWPSGGPNHLPQGADPLLAALIVAGTKPAKCFVDACEVNGSWASNEGQISETAALLLASGLYAM